MFPKVGIPTEAEPYKVRMKFLGGSNEEEKGSKMLDRMKSEENNVVPLIPKHKGLIITLLSYSIDFHSSIQTAFSRIFSHIFFLTSSSQKRV